jgi:peptidoglycan-associated lipoprotein
MNGKTFLGMVLACAMVAASLTACSTSQSDKSAMMSPSSSTSAQTRTPSKASASSVRQAQMQSGGQSSLDALRRGQSTATAPNSALKEIYFDFDQYDLSSNARATLKTSSDWLRSNPSVRVEVEGHCDERGTSEYNLALGAKRAQAAKDYLVSLGVAPGRVSTISYGEEIPVCREHDESCWSKNRRDRFVALNAKPGV